MKKYGNIKNYMKKYENYMEIIWKLYENYMEKFKRDVIGYDRFGLLSND